MLRGCRSDFEQHLPVTLASSSSSLLLLVLLLRTTTMMTMKIMTNSTRKLLLLVLMSMKLRSLLSSRLAKQLDRAQSRHQPVQTNQYSFVTRSPCELSHRPLLFCVVLVSQVPPDAVVSKQEVLHRSFCRFQ